MRLLPGARSTPMNTKLRRLALFVPALLLVPIAGLGTTPAGLGRLPADVAAEQAGPAASEGRGITFHQVQLAAVNPARRTTSLTLEVLAPSAQQAEAAAIAAVESRGLTPLLPGGGVSAQWLPWLWKWDSSELPVPVAYNPTGAPESVGPPAILAALQAWSNTGASSFAFRYAGITENTASILETGPDGENVISWASLPCDSGCVLALTSKLDGHEVDMLLNSNPLAAEQLGVGSVLDWRTIILHELGHVAGLDHSCPVPFGPCTEAEAEAVMYFAYRGTLRKLAPDDIAGLAALYPLAGTPASPTPPGSGTPTPFPELVVILEDGWNLLVLPAGAVAPVAGALPCLEAVYRWEEEAWSAWVRGLPAALQGFATLEPGRGYWALSNGACAHIFP